MRALLCYIVLTLVLVTSSAFGAETDVKIIYVKHRQAAELAPVVREVLGEAGKVVAFEDRLILRAPKDELKKARKLIATLDVEKAVLQVTVRQKAQQGVETAGGALTLSTDAAHGAPSSGAIPSFRGNGRYSRTIGNAEKQTEQFVKVLEGEAAFVTTGRRIPFSQFKAVVAGENLSVLETVNYYDVTTGFWVSPQVQDGEVVLTITPHLSEPSAGKQGGVDFQNSSTQATDRPQAVRFWSKSTSNSERRSAMAVVEISVTPLGTGTPGVSQFVAGCVRIIGASGLNYQLTPMGTIIEGDLDEIFQVIRKMHEAPFAAGAARVSTLIKIDDRRDRAEHTMQGKMSSVQGKI